LMGWRLKSKIHPMMELLDRLKSSY